MEKYVNCHFGCCSRVYCNNQNLLPVGLSDKPNVDSVKLFCPCCKEVYNPPSLFAGTLPSNRRDVLDIDGAFFGTTFPHMFLLQYPNFLSWPSQKYQPTIFGFQIHESSPYYVRPEKKKKKDSKKDRDPTIRSV